jgi:protein-S-isoprenylcysteine O-methyltransferase Ste14
MTLPLIWFDIAARATVALCWMVFGVAALLRWKPWHDPERKRDPAPILGLIVQGVAHAMVWLVRRQRFTPIVPLSAPIEIALAVASIALGIGSVWMILAAMHTLGKHWSVAARLVEGHTLVTDGPYRVVRHPIYAANFGLLLATGLAFSRLGPLLLASFAFWIGSVIRVRGEERLLREAFGEEYEAYARRVPALFPRLC